MASVVNNKLNLTATIANGASLSDSLDLNERTIVGLLMPAAWTAADITFSVSWDNTTFYDLTEADGTEHTFTVTVDQHIIADPVNFAGVRYLKVRSGTSAVPAAQGAERLIGVLVREV